MPFYYKTSGMEAAAMLADLIENDTGISKEIKMGCELVEPGISPDNRIVKSGRNRFFWKGICFFFIPLGTGILVLISVLMEYVQFSV